MMDHQNIDENGDNGALFHFTYKWSIIFTIWCCIYVTEEDIEQKILNLIIIH